jgi:hypothetical protein
MGEMEGEKSDSLSVRKEERVIAIVLYFNENFKKRLFLL